MGECQNHINESKDVKKKREMQYIYATCEQINETHIKRLQLKMKKIRITKYYG